MASKTDEQFTVTSFQKLWDKKLLPSIKNEIRIEIKVEIDRIETSIKDLTTKYSDIEKSQNFMSKKFDELLSSLQQSKKRIQTLESKVKEQDDIISKFAEQALERDHVIDEVQQYSRRDCLEIVGIPQITNEDPKKVLKELCSVMAIDLEDSDISIAHRLPDTKKVKDRIIVKFVRRDKKEEIYKNRRRLIGKTTINLPSIKNELGMSIPTNPTKIFVNESLTSYRRKVFNRVYNFKKNHKYKYIWTVNGKIFLKRDDSGETYSFINLNDFDTFEYTQGQ